VKPIAIALVLFVSGSGAFAQTGRGAITGTIVTNSGDAAGSATIQAKEQSTGKVFTAVTSKTGRYRLADLPAGTYEISVPQLGLRTSRYAKPNVVVEAAKTLSLDIALMPNNFGILGDDAGFLQMMNKYADIKGPAPRMPDGHPDFSGVWLCNVDLKL